MKDPSLFLGSRYGVQERKTSPFPSALITIVWSSAQPASPTLPGKQHLDVGLVAFHVNDYHFPRLHLLRHHYGHPTPTLTFIPLIRIDRALELSKQDRIVDIDILLR